MIFFTSAIFLYFFHCKPYSFFSAYISSQDVFSDEEFEDVTPSSSNLRTAYEARSTPPPPPPAEGKKAQKVSFSLPPHHAEGGNKDETDEVEQELDLFSKAIHISNIDEVSWAWAHY